MGTILFECPKTGRPVSTGIETEPISFCRLTETWLEVYCPPLRALPWGEGMARSGNVSFYVLQQKCCDPNKLRSRAIRVVAFFFADRLRERSRGIEINRRELTLRAWTMGRAV